MTLSWSSKTWVLAVALSVGLTVSLEAATMPGTYNITDFGAKGDGRHDDTPAFRRAVAEAAKVGGCVLLPPVVPGGGYVLTGTVRLEPGVSLIGALAGMPFIAWEGVPREMQRGAVILARPRKEDYEGEKKQPLFELLGGNTVRGLYILYDQQPWPSDKELEASTSPYRYDTFEQFRSRFVAEHAKPYGPTFYSRHAPSVTIEDITCGRYYDFCVFHLAGKVFIERCYLYGYKRAFAIKHGPDTIRFRGIHVVPNVERSISHEHSKLHAAITACDDNVAFDFGAVDGYSVEDVVVFLAHTGFKLGASEASPFFDPVENSRESFSWGKGPWGSIQNVKLDNVALGFHCVTGTILPNQLQNLMVHVSIPSDQKVQTGSGQVARQAAFFVEPGFAGATLTVHNLSISSFAPTNVLAGAQMVQRANGRAFLIDCPGYPDRVDYAERKQACFDIFGLVLSNIPSTHFLAVTPGTTPDVRVVGFTHNGVRQADGALIAK
ncbi:MAG: hypothetical protein HY318_09240 [Armatimonadetes bacterium]|nr:hypothetical protein [Armatimonadota bacterium]